MQEATPNLTGALRDMSSVHRPAVMQALLTKPRVQEEWTTRDGRGCFWAIATRRVTGMSRRQFMEDPSGASARTFGVSRDRVSQVYAEWDRLTPEEMDGFIASVRAEVEANVRAIEPRSSQNRGAAMAGMLVAICAVVAVVGMIG